MNRYGRQPRRYIPKKRPRGKRLKFSPGADKALIPVFKRIGAPPRTRFRPDPFQLHAVETVAETDCLVTAPTGTGKTWIAQKAMERIFQKGGKAWYATPLKALSNAKYAEFSDVFGQQNTGILTGDRKENSDAPLIVGTTEILRNQLYDAMQNGTDLDTDFVALDEAHYLSDEDRGVVWEEIMIYLPVRIPILMLSATVGNAREVADWLSEIRGRRCVVVAAGKRPVPLFPLFLHPSGTLYPLLKRRAKGKDLLYPKVHAAVTARPAPRFSAPGGTPPYDKFLRVLGKYNLLPAIFFLKSRADCDHALDVCTDRPVDKTRKARLSRRIESLLSQSPRLRTHRQLSHLEQFAVGAHHSGQLPAWKMVIETLMSEGLLDAVFATSTVAAGVNFPARTIVALNSDRFNGREFLPLTPTEFHQMTGRAGRRGKDRIGFSVVVPGRFMDTRLMAQLCVSRPSPLVSQIKINFSMVLNLLQSHSSDQIQELLNRSFAAFLLKKQVKPRSVFPNFHQDFLWNDFCRHLGFLKETGYVSGKDTLTDAGRWASRLRIDQPLLVAEGFRRDAFPIRSPEILAAVTAALVNEKETDGLQKKDWIPAELHESFALLQRRLKPFIQQMARAGFPTRRLYFRPAATIYAWAAGFSWEEVVEISEMAEGDLAMLILRTQDNLRHITALSDVFPQAARSARIAIEQTTRDPLTTDYGF